MSAIPVFQRTIHCQNNLRMQKQIEDFFENYSLRFNRDLHEDPASGMDIKDDFTGCFIAAGPAGVVCGKNDASFVAAISSGYDFYRKIGISGMKILSKKITVLDELHALTEIGWRCFYSAKNSAGEIDFKVFYFVQVLNARPKIFAYITGDEQAAFRNAGLI